MPTGGSWPQPLCSHHDLLIVLSGGALCGVGGTRWLVVRYSHVVGTAEDTAVGVAGCEGGVLPDTRVGAR